MGCTGESGSWSGEEEERLERGRSLQHARGCLVSSTYSVTHAGQAVHLDRAGGTAPCHSAAVLRTKVSQRRREAEPVRVKRSNDAILLVGNEHVG